MGRIVGDNYYLSPEEKLALAEKNKNAPIRMDLLLKSNETEQKYAEAARLRKIEDRNLPRYYDYTINGKLKNAKFRKNK